MTLSTVFKSKEPSRLHEIDDEICLSVTVLLLLKIPSNKTYIHTNAILSHQMTH